MYKYNEKIGERLNDLLEKNYDAEAGYKKAAEHASSPTLTQFFNRKAEERKSFGHDIKAEIEKFGREPEKGTSIAGDVHRTWMDTKALFSSNDDNAMLEAAITGEKKALEEYQEVMNETRTELPELTNKILQDHYQKINNDLQSINSMEDIK